MTDSTPAPPSLRLGRRPASRKPTLKARQFLQPVVLPKVPDAADHLSGATYDLGRNSEFGTCGPTSLANYVRLVTAHLTGAQCNPTWDDIATLYRRQNPGFDPAKPGGGQDDGVDMKTMLADAVKYGFGAEEILGFAEVNATDPQEVEACVAVFGGVLLGLDLAQAQSDQLAAGVWDYAPGSPAWGGHAVVEGAYEADDDEDCITWAQRVRMTRAFSARQRAEAYVVILREHLGHAQFMTGWDLAQFAAAFEAITGRPFPADVTPPPPAVHPDDVMADAVRDWALNRRHSGLARVVAEALKAWFRATGRHG